MSKIYIKEISCCDDCPAKFRIPLTQGVIHKCGFMVNERGHYPMIDDTASLPEFCPLEDVEKEASK